MHIKIWIKLSSIALLKFKSNRAYWNIATSNVEFLGLPPSAITIAKLKKQRENIIEKTANKLCFIIGNSNFKIFPKKLRFIDSEIS